MGKAGEDLGRKRKSYIFAPEPVHHGRRAVFYLAIVLGVVILTLVTLNFVNNHQVQLDVRRLTVQNLPADLENWSILHISDLNGQEIGTKQSGVKAAIQNRSFSCVVFTGDMVGESGNVQPLLDLIAVLPGDVPKFLITGDNDPSLTDPSAHGSLSVFADWVTRVQEAGVTVLDEPLCLTRGKSNIWFVPEYYYSLDLDSMETAWKSQLTNLEETGVILSPDQAALKRLCEYQLEKIGRIRQVRADIGTKNDVQIAVTHVPLTKEDVTIAREGQDESTAFSFKHVSLVLAGHYCAGQWRIPGVGAVYVPGKGWWPEDSLITGLDYLSGLPQYISPGLGASSYYTWQPGRIFNAPTVSLIYLTNRIV